VARRRENVAPGLRSQRHPAWWTGDVWKVVSVLRKYRPDLQIYSLNAAPTGLVLITRLDPTSSLLHDKYFDITDEFRRMGSEHLREHVKSTEFIPTSEFLCLEDISQFLWL
jgi:hypothetical protein